MHLTNISELRIQNYTEGWVVEIQKTNWFRRKKWVHLISVAGIESEPYYFKSHDDALEEALKYFKWDLINGSTFQLYNSFGAQYRCYNRL